MPRSNWKGVISFGLVSIPIALFNSEETSNKALFHQIDKRNKARIKYKRINVETGKEVPWEEIIQGYVYDKDTVLAVEEEELKKVAGENARTIAIENFIKKENIDFVHVNKTYYLIPEKKGEKGYVILREALKKANMVGIAKVIISTKEYVSAVACYKNALVLYLLRYDEEVRPLSEFDLPSEDLKKYKVTTKEINTALMLIKSLSEKWNPKKYKDEYQAAIHKWAANKIKHKSTVTIMRQRAPSGVKGKNIEFIDLLRKSMAGAKKSKHVPVSHLRKHAHGKRAAVH